MIRVTALEDAAEADGSRKLQIRKMITKPLANGNARDDLAPDPAASKSLCRLERRPASTEWIENHVPLVRRDLNAATRNHWLQLIDVPARLELLVPSRGRVLPEISEVEAKGIQILPVSSIVLDVLAAVSAGWHWEANMVENLGFALREVQKSVVCGIELSAAWKSPLHRQRDPVAKEHPLIFNMTRKVKAPPREYVDKKSTSGFEYTNRLIDPRERPLQVIPFPKRILDGSIPIILPEIKGRVSEDTVNGVVLECSKEVEAICRVQQTKVRGQSGLEKLHPCSPARYPTRALFARRSPNVALVIEIARDSSTSLLGLTRHRQVELSNSPAQHTSPSLACRCAS